MKKTLLLLSAIIISAGASAQNSVASSFSTIGYVQDIWGVITDTYMISHFKVKNNANGTKVVRCSKQVLSAVGLTSNDFCWGMGCYDTLTIVSGYDATIPPGASDSTFKGTYYPNSQYGTTWVRYRFYDKNNTTDSMSVVVAYHVTPTGIAKPVSQQAELNASPNPANGMAAIGYKLAPGSTNASIVISNMLGEKVEEIGLQETQSTVILMTGHYKAGVYFYSLVVDGKTSATRKLVVAH